MAIAGGATTAYRVRIQDGALHCERTTTLASLCTPVDDALRQLREGQTVTVMGSSMHQLRTLYTSGDDERA